ncbi:MAG TPA: nucleotidyltransferase domain-containing protein [Fimbriimonas sp.]|nr:nucleotidyltransferase domain-containing protein [Fimbriimonas sp.]
MPDIPQPQILEAQVRSHPYPLLFSTISGAHLYGFPSPDSDFDLRGAHVLPASNVVGLDLGDETLQRSEVVEGVEVDLVTHDVRKFFTLMLRRNGYVLEQLYSPLVVSASPEFQELKELGKGCVTKHHVHHYAGFANTEWGLFRKLPEPRAKPLLYVYRVLLTGIHLMRTGRVEADLPSLAEEYGEYFLRELIGFKRTGLEKGALVHPELDFHQRNFDRLMERLYDESAKSDLPGEPSAKPALNDLLVRIRLGG